MHSCTKQLNLSLQFYSHLSDLTTSLYTVILLDLLVCKLWYCTISNFSMVLMHRNYEAEVCVLHITVKIRKYI